MIRRVLITGAGSGIGLATTRHLRSLGFEAIGLVPPGEEATQLEQEGVRTLVVDLADADQRAGVVEDLDLWALVNNAGYMNAGLLLDVPLSDARRQLEAMVLGPIDLARQAVPAMARRGHGRIVMVTSSAAHTSAPLSGWYVAAKAALRELTDSLRVELSPTGIDVIDVEPGGFRTGIWPRARTEMSDHRRGSARPEVYDRVLKHLGNAEKPMGEPERVAEAIGHLLTTGKPTRHRRIGPGARLLRFSDDIVPDAARDRAAMAAAGLRSESIARP